jgi:hypothetical protein
MAFNMQKIQIMNNAFQWTINLKLLKIYFHILACTCMFENLFNLMHIKNMKHNIIILKLEEFS